MEGAWLGAGCTPVVGRLNQGNRRSCGRRHNEQAGHKYGRVVVLSLTVGSAPANESNEGLKLLTGVHTLQQTMGDTL